MTYWPDFKPVNGILEQAKIQCCLLDIDHPQGGTKARLLVSLGYSATNWQRLEGDLRHLHLTEDVVTTVETPWVTRYEVVAPLAGPAGDTVLFRSVWQIDLGEDAPRLITIYPE